MKHEKIFTLTVAKQNSVSELVSKALNDKISDNEFNLILCELKKYYELKTAIRSKMVSRSQPQQPDVEKKKKKKNRKEIHHVEREKI